MVLVTSRGPRGISWLAASIKRQSPNKKNDSVHCGWIPADSGGHVDRAHVTRLCPALISHWLMSITSDLHPIRHWIITMPLHLHTVTIPHPVIILTRNLLLVPHGGELIFVLNNFPKVTPSQFRKVCSWMGESRRCWGGAVLCRIWQQHNSRTSTSSWRSWSWRNPGDL